jgi:hypothetical protein
MVWECIHAKQANQQMIEIGAHVPTIQRRIRMWERPLGVSIRVFLK